MIGGARRGLRGIWYRRRWLYAASMVIAVTRLPARTGFRLTWPACDLRLTLENVGLSLTKVPHIVLFGAFFLLTVVQFDQLDRRALAWSLVATAMLSMLIEFQQGATRTGNCRLTDVAPNLLGALIVAALGIAALGIRHRLRVQPNVASRR
jgi:VanZ family protein